MKSQFKLVCHAAWLLGGANCITGCGSSGNSNTPSAIAPADVGHGTMPVSTRQRSHRSTSSSAATGSYNMNAPLVPDPRLTPGDVLDVTSQDFCTPGYSKKVRNVPQAVKEQAYNKPIKRMASRTAPRVSMK